MADKQDSIFRWETLREIGRGMLPFKEPIHGVILEVEVISGGRVQVFRADDAQFYFCHGLTFGGNLAPGGAVSPFSGKDVNTILDELYFEVEREVDAITGDVLVWYDLDGDAIHSAMMVQPIVGSDADVLDYSSILRSKNGNCPETLTTLEKLVDGKESYGESYSVYRRK